MRYQYDVMLLKMRQKLHHEETIWSGDKKTALIIEWIICLLHPNHFLHSSLIVNLKDCHLKTYNSVVQIHTVSKWNDVLAVASMVRVSLICLFAISMSGIASNRAKRLALLYGYELGFSNIVKTLVKEVPFKTVTFATFISIITFAYCLRICERPLTDILGDQHFGYLSSSIWCVVVTMMTGRLSSLTASRLW